MKNSDIHEGVTLIAKAYCGFPDGTTQGKEYKVTKTSESFDQKLFFILNDINEEVMPISTVFEIKK